MLLDPGRLPDMSNCLACCITVTPDSITETTGVASVLETSAVGGGNIGGGGGGASVIMGVGGSAGDLGVVAVGSEAKSIKDGAPMGRRCGLCEKFGPPGLA